MKLRFLIPALLAARLFLPALHAQSQDEQSSQISLQKLVALQKAWGPKASTTGSALQLKEVSRAQSEGHTVVKYRMIATGFPPGKTYSIVMWQMGAQPQTTLQGITLDSSGTAICAGKPGTCGTAAHPDDPIDLDMFAARGEVKRVGLVSSDDSAKVFTSIVPFPNRGVDGACSLDATLITRNAEAVLLSANGFKPGTSLDVNGDSEGEKQHSVYKTDENGHAEWVVGPFKKGLSKGRLQITAQSESCKPSVTLPWGDGSYVLK